MPVKVHDLKLPPGMVVMMHAGGIYQLHYADKDTVKLYDWALNLANQLQPMALNWLEDQKTLREKQKEQREADLVAHREKEKIRRDAKIKEMFNPTDPNTQTNEEIIRVRRAEIPKPVRVQLTEPLQPRKVNTASGILEVEGDISDQDLKNLGIEVLPLEENTTSVEEAPAK